MNIELKELKFGAEHSHQETLNFVCDVYADGKLVGYANNDGHGGCTFVHPCERGSLNAVEEYCKTLPDVPYGSGLDGAFKQTLDFVVDDLVNTAYNKKQIEKINKSITRKFKQCLIVGNKSEWEAGTMTSYKEIKFTHPFETIKNLGKEHAANIKMHEIIKKHHAGLSDGEAILNDNLAYFLED